MRVTAASLSPVTDLDRGLTLDTTLEKNAPTILMATLQSVIITLMKSSFPVVHNLRL